MLKLRLNGYEPVIIFAVSLFLFTFGVGNQEVIGFESRFYLFALEMWRHGFSWFPTTYGEPYPDYPVTSTWLIYLVAQFFGHLSKLPAVIPGAIAAALTVALTYLIGAVRNHWWGWFAALLLLMTFGFIKIARSISLDIYPTLITTWCFFLVLNADQKNKTEYLGWVYFLFFLGFAFRGPIGLIIPAAVVCSYQLLACNYRRMFFSAAFALLILIVSLAILLGIAHVVGGVHFVDQVLMMQIVGRLEASHLPYYYYFLDCFSNYALSYPIAVLVFLGTLFYWLRLSVYSTDLKLLFKLIVWALIILVGMSVPGDKKIRYVLAITPALALIATYPLVAASDEKYFKWLHWLLTRFFLLIPVIFLIGFRYLHSYADTHQLQFDIDYSRIDTVMYTLLSVSSMVFFKVKKKLQWVDLTVLAAAAIAFVYVYIYVAEPIYQYLDRTREFVTTVEDLREQQNARLVFYKEGRDGLPIKYLINVGYDERPEFIATEPQLENYPAPAFFITSAQYYEALSPHLFAQYRVVARDRIGHVPVVVFTNR